ncbi:MAG: tyrosine-type recombinase/integrase [Pseudomonadota bacterium]
MSVESRINVCFCYQNARDKREKPAGSRSLYSAEVRHYTVFLCGPYAAQVEAKALKKNLTDKLLKSIQPPSAGRVVVTDTVRPGLRFRVTSSGKKSFLFEKKVKGGRRLAETLGSYPELSLTEARGRALRIEVEAQAGIDRRKLVEEERATRAADEAQARRVGELLNLYVEQHIRPNLKAGRSREERERQLRSSLMHILDKRIGDLSRADLQAIVDAKAAEGKIPMANRLRAALCAFTGWCWQRDYVDLDPGAKVQKGGKEKPRTRAPSIEETTEIWHATFSMGALWGPLFRLIILTGQRRNEIARMRWAWLNETGQRIEIPDSKNNRPHIVHLAEPALLELASIREYQADKGIKSAFVFTTTGATPVDGTSKALRRMRDRIDASRSALGQDPLEHFTLHDIRRSMATALAGAGFSEGVVDRIQNHVASGSRPSQVSAVYQLNEMLDARARALDYWATLIACG